MIDPRMLYDAPDEVLANLQRRGITDEISSVVAGGKKRKEFLHKIEQLRHAAKQISEKVGVIMKSGAPATSAEPLKQESQRLKAEIKTAEDALQRLESGLEPALLSIPNLLDSSVPAGSSAADNREIRRWGDELKRTEATPDHQVIATQLGIIDFDRAARLAGSRFAVLKGMAARLELALIQFMIDTHITAGYTPIIPPYLVNSKTLTGTGQLPKFQEEVFHLEKDGYYLIPTAEVPVTNLYMDEILTPQDLPMHFVAFSPCFRREAGSYGKDIKGLIRQHQFHKVELVKFTTPENSYAELESLTLDAERILQKLRLPYRVIALCGGDTGFSAAKTYDIEVWLPGQQAYREISSCSNCTDFQARRINTRYKPNNTSKPQFVHTLNGSGVAVGRTLIAILENYYNTDGSVTIPDVLRPYLAGIDRIR